MNEQVVVANPYNEEHIHMFQRYEEQNNICAKTSQHLMKTKTLMKEEEFRRLEQENTEITRILFLQKKGKIITAAHLVGEKDRKICRMIIDNIASHQQQEKLLAEAEKYAFTCLGMEEIILLQEQGNQIPSTYFASHEFEDLGVESGMQVYMKSRAPEKQPTYQI